MTAQLFPNVLPQLAHSFLFLPGTEVAFSRADRSQRQGDQPLHQAIRAQRQLERAPADVHDDGSAHSQIEMRERAAEGEPRFILAMENFHLEAGLRPYELEKLLSVARLPHRTRGHDLGALDPELVGERRHPLRG